MAGKKIKDEEMAQFVDGTGWDDSPDFDAIADELRQPVERDKIVVKSGSSFALAVPAKPPFRYNVLASLEGYLGFGVNYRKDWEIEMALKTLHDWGGAHPNANILGVGAGTERTIFELANASSAKLVTATDIYKTPGVWGDWHGKKFLKNPHAFAPAGLPYDQSRVVAMHADMCKLPFGDEGYDAVFSSGSIEHVGKAGIADWDAISKAAREIGRVLKKGGIASISTEFKVSGEGWGFGHVRLFSVDDLMKYIIEPSGLVPVDMPDWGYKGNLAEYVELAAAVHESKAEMNKPLLHHDGFLFTSVHLALRRI